MEEPAVESLENNQHSDSEYEKVQYPPPGEEDSSGAVKDVDTRETPATTPPNLGRAVERPGKEGKTTKSQLESSSNARVESKETVCWTTDLDPSVLDLIYWRDVKKTAIVLATSLLILTIFAIFPLLSIIAYTSLLVLTVTFGLRLYGNILCYIKKSKEPHLLSKYVEKEISFPADCIHKCADQLVINVSKVVDDVRKLFLVERFLDSIKFALLLWLMTFIGAWFSGVAVLMIGDIILFTIPKFYQVYQKQIDEFLSLANAKLKSLEKSVLEKLQRKRKEQ